MIVYMFRAMSMNIEQWIVASMTAYNSLITCLKKYITPYLDMLQSTRSMEEHQSLL